MIARSPNPIAQSASIIPLPIMIPLSKIVPSVMASSIFGSGMFDFRKGSFVERGCITFDAAAPGESGISPVSL
jgi:hypothetical protein